MKHTIAALIVTLFFLSPALALVGQEAYEIRTRDLITAEEITLTQFRGTPIHLVFFYTKCPPCQREMQRLVDSASLLTANGTQIIGIAMDRQESDVKAYVTDRGIGFPVGMATPSIVMLYEDVRMVPFTYLIDENGIVTAQYMGRIPDQIFLELLP